MRKRLLSLAAIVIVVSACASGATSSQGGGPVQPPGARYQPPTQGPVQPAQPQPAGSAYDGVTFQDPGTNPVTDTDEDKVSTFAMDVDTASYTIAQRFVDDGNLPDPSSIRVEEWVNAFDQGYAAPSDDTFAVHVDAARTPFAGQGDVLLRIGIKARDVHDRQRAPAALTFVIDTSGSMDREGRLELVKDALRTLVRSLGQKDTIAVVTFGDDARVVLGPTPASRAQEILGAIEQLRPGGSTNLEAGLRLGYSLARESRLGDGGTDRIVLASDGVANVGLTDADGILRQIRDDAASGIELVSVGVGMGNYNDALLEQLADQGDGFYAYVNGLDEARRLFRDDLVGTLQTVALDAKVQVRFDPNVVASYRLIGYENRAIPDGQFRDPNVAAGAIGAGHAVTALYALTLRGDAALDGRLGSVALRWTEPAATRESHLDQDILGRVVLSSDGGARFADADPTLRLDAIVAATAAALRGPSGSADASLRSIEQVARRGDDLPPTDQARNFLALLQRMVDLGG
jgi:Ca-activated chloride channel family protein